MLHSKQKIAFEKFELMESRKGFDTQISTHLGAALNLTLDEGTLLFSQLRRYVLEVEVTRFCIDLEKSKFHKSVIDTCRANKITERSVKTMEVGDLTGLKLGTSTYITYGDASRIKAMVGAIQTPKKLKEENEVFIRAEKVNVKLMAVDESYNKFQATVSMRMTWKSMTDLPITANVNTRSEVVPDYVWLPPLSFHDLSSPDSFSVICHSVTIVPYETATEDQKKIPSKNTDNKNPYVIYRWKAHGEFCEILKLHKFPLDTHKFEMTLWPQVTTQYTPKFVPKEKVEKFGQIVRPAAKGDCEDWDVHPKTLFYPKNYVSTIQISAQRKTTYYIWNCLAPMFCIVAAGFVVFVEKEASSIFSRFEASAAIVAAVVFFKFSTGVTVCKTQYLTYMDLYLLAAFLVTFGLIIGHSISCVLDLAHPDQLNDSLPASAVTVDYIFSIGMATLWIGLHIFIVIVIFMYGRAGPPEPSLVAHKPDLDKSTSGGLAAKSSTIIVTLRNYGLKLH
ncbi:hypothetical protein Pelo_12882 [Pelomyxa schiedti]|nr:hypothetical protein Pelo_12882 [Pelomyxa schiedti]